MLSIRDDEVRSLAVAVMKERGAPTLTAAIKLALRNELRREGRSQPLSEKIDALRETARRKAVRAPDRGGPDARDTLWD